jgi:PAS domain-containing protein
VTEGPATFSGGWAGLQVSGNDTAANGATTELISVLDSIEVPIVVVQRDLTMAAFNQAAADSLGLSLPDIGRMVCDISVFAGWSSPVC